MKSRSQRSTDVAPQRGAALLFTLIVAISIGVLSLGLLSMNLETSASRARTGEALQSFYVAEAGLSEALKMLSSGEIALPEGGEFQLGSAEEPMALGQSSFWVTLTDLPTHDVSIVGAGSHNGTLTRLELTASEVPDGFFLFAAFGADGLEIESNALIDSYDSTLGTYDSQVIGGGVHWARENGTVGSNHDIWLSSNAEIHGDALHGPRGRLDDSSPGAYVSGTVSPAVERIKLTSIDIPPIPQTGNLDTSGDTVLSGDVHFGSARINGGDVLTIRGPARVVAGDFMLQSNAALIFDSTHGEIELFAQRDFVLESNAKVVTWSDSATDVTLWLQTNNLTELRPHRLALNSNADFIGAIYAPNARIDLASNFAIYGSVIAGQLRLQSNAKIHFDEALLYDNDGDPPEYEPTLWRRLGRPVE